MDVRKSIRFPKLASHFWINQKFPRAGFFRGMVQRPCTSQHLFPNNNNGNLHHHAFKRTFPQDRCITMSIDLNQFQGIEKNTCNWPKSRNHAETQMSQRDWWCFGTLDHLGFSLSSCKKGRSFRKDQTDWWACGDPPKPEMKWHTWEKVLKEGRSTWIWLQLPCLLCLAQTLQKRPNRKVRGMKANRTAWQSINECSTKGSFWCSSLQFCFNVPQGEHSDAADWKVQKMTCIAQLLMQQSLSQQISTKKIGAHAGSVCPLVHAALCGIPQHSLVNGGRFIANKNVPWQSHTCTLIASHTKIMQNLSAPFVRQVLKIISFQFLCEWFVKNANLNSNETFNWNETSKNHFCIWTHKFFMIIPPKQCLESPTGNTGIVTHALCGTFSGSDCKQIPFHVRCVRWIEVKSAN